MKIALPFLLISGAVAFSANRAFAPQYNNAVSRSSVSSSALSMFGGAADDDDEEVSEEQEAQIEQAAKAMGFSVSEYKLVLRMQKQLADAVNGMRCSAGNDVKVTIDGNSPPLYLDIDVSETTKGKGAVAVETAFVAAYKEAANEAKKGQQAAVQNMNQDIAGEMKKMGIA